MNPTERPDASAADTNGPRPAAERIDVTRRRLFRGAAAGTGVLLATQSRTALGAVCESPSAAFSGNLSAPEEGNGSCSGGRSPGFWRQPQHFPHWREGGQEPPFFKGEVIDCASGLGDLKKLTLADISGGTMFSTVFGSLPPLKDGTTRDVPLWAVLGMHDLFDDPGNLLWHFTAIWLNANYFRSGGEIYPILPEQVIQLWRTVAFGEPYCPDGAVCGGSKPAWGKAEVVEYIMGMTTLYDDNSPVPNLCTPRRR